MIKELMHDPLFLAKKAEKATQEDYDKIIKNTQNSDAKKRQKVLYGIATQRTELRTFPSDIAVWDDPADSDFDLPMDVKDTNTQSSQSTSTLEKITQTIVKQRKAVKITILYDDGTYQELM